MAILTVSMSIGFDVVKGRGAAAEDIKISQRQLIRK